MLPGGQGLQPARPSGRPPRQVCHCGGVLEDSGLSRVPLRGGRYPRCVPSSRSCLFFHFSLSTLSFLWFLALYSRRIHKFVFVEGFWCTPGSLSCTPMWQQMPAVCAPLLLLFFLDRSLAHYPLRDVSTSSVPEEGLWLTLHRFCPRPVSAFVNAV